MTLEVTATVANPAPANFFIDFTFDWLDEGDISVYKNGSATAMARSTWKFITRERIEVLSGNFAADDSFKLLRETQVGSSAVTFVPGASIRAQDLNQNQQQVRFVSEELNERSVKATGGSMTGNLEMNDANVVFEGSNANDHETTLSVVDPTADQTYRLPNLSAGTYNLITTGDTNTVTGTMIAADAINGDRIADDSINSEHYVDGSIDSAHIANDQIDSQHYAAGSIDLEHMSANSVDSDQYVDGSIDRVHLAADIVDGTKIADDSIDSEHIAAGAVDLEHMSANSVDSDQYVDGSIDLIHMSANSVDSDQYVDGSIDRVHLAADIIDGTKIADDVVNSEHIAAGAVDLEHMSANSVDSDQYVDGSIDLVHLAADSVDGTKIADDAINSEHIAAGAVDLEHMSANSVDSDQYVDGSIDNVHLAANSVTSAKIEDGTIVNADINASAAIAGSKISMSLNQLSDVNVGTPGSAQDDQVLAWDNANSEFSLTAASGGGGLGDIVDDSSPQLGGALDVNGNSITSASNGNVVIDPHGTGAINLQAATNVTGATAIDGDLTLDNSHNLIFEDNSGSNSVTLGVPDDVTASTTINLPAAAPTTANRFLRASGTGTTSPFTLEWANVDTSGASSNIVALNNPATIDSFTVADNRNVAMAGPLTINNGETITVGSGSTFTIL